MWVIDNHWLYTHITFVFGIRIRKKLKHQTIRNEIFMKFFDCMKTESNTSYLKLFSKNVDITFITALFDYTQLRYVHLSHSFWKLNGFLFVQPIKSKWRFILHVFVFMEIFRVQNFDTHCNRSEMNVSLMASWHCQLTYFVLLSNIQKTQFET